VSGVLGVLRQIAEGDGDTELLALRAHDAVAELIEAATQVDALSIQSGAHRRLRAALARAEGSR
jgi:hypothetical protein